jgi:hypothetical protein
MDMLGYFSVKKPDVVHETIDGETVIVNLENGIYYSLRNSGVDMWNLLEAGANLDELTEAMIGRFDGSQDEIRRAITELLVVLQQEGLVKVSSTKREDSQTDLVQPLNEKKKFDVPVLEKYSDMQELLLLDPIHEVDEEGWPHKAEESGTGNAEEG